MRPKRPSGPTPQTPPAIDPPPAADGHLLSWESLSDLTARTGASPDAVFSEVMKSHEALRQALHALTALPPGPLLTRYAGVASVFERLGDLIKPGAIHVIGTQTHVTPALFDLIGRETEAAIARAGAIIPIAPMGVAHSNHNTAQTASQALDAPLRHLSLFQSRVENASVLMSCAFAAAQVTDFKPVTKRPSLRAANATSAWFTQVVNACLDHFASLRGALVHSWTETPQAQALATEAFVMLAEMTSAKARLVDIHAVDPLRARVELVRLLDPIAEEVAATARLMAGEAPTNTATAPAQDALQAAILAKAGPVWSLSQAAEAMDVSRQYLHKRIVQGAVLGVMQGRSLVVPQGQFERIGVKSRPIAGLGKVIGLFRQAEAGDWSALQFLVDHDPNLVETPMAALHSGKAKAVETAARAYLSLDEG